MKCAPSYVFFVITALIILLGGVIRCGVIGTIEGGNKDSLPPVFIRGIPDTNAVNVTFFHPKHNKLQLFFNEYVQLNSAHKIRLNPQPEKIPDISSDLNSIIINFKEPLKKDYTYTVDFKNFIGDLNENNKSEPLFYVFSTGPQIHHYEIKGKIWDSETTLADSLSSVLLYEAAGFEDSSIYKNPPLYITQPDSAGNFHFKYLKPGNYYLFALHDKDDSRTYNASSENFAFLDSIIPYRTDSSSAGHMLFTAKKENPKIERPPPTQRIKGKIVPKYKINTETGNTLHYHAPIILQLYDSVAGIAIDKIKLLDTLSARDTTAQYENTFVDSIQFTLKKGIPYIHIYHNLDLDDKYVLILEPGWINDSAFISPKNDTIPLQLLPDYAYKRLSIRCTNCLALHHPAVELLQQDKKYETLSLKDTFPSPSQRLPKGSYTLRLFDDRNQNQIRDIGDYAKKEQPERYFRLKNSAATIEADPKNLEDVPVALTIIPYTFDKSNLNGKDSLGIPLQDSTKTSLLAPNLNDTTQKSMKSLLKPKP